MKISLSKLYSGLKKVKNGDEIKIGQKFILRVGKSYSFQLHEVFVKNVTPQIFLVSSSLTGVSAVFTKKDCISYPFEYGTELFYYQEGLLPTIKLAETWLAKLPKKSSMSREFDTEVLRDYAKSILDQCAQLEAHIILNPDLACQDPM